jgi:ADP-heptose:LPS heptosyltransferase
MNKNFSIFGFRGSLCGDQIMALPLLNYFESLYPNSYKTWTIAKKTSQMLPFFTNQKLIDRILITENNESLGLNDVQLVKSSNIFINPFPQHPPCPGLNVGIDNFWYNKFNCVTETARMAGISEKDFLRLPEIERKPRLYQWFETEKRPKSIAIHARAGYNKEQSRNPTTQFWRELTPKIQKMGYKIFHCGVDSEEDIGENITRITHLSLFEQIRVSLSTDLVLGNDSGFNWIIGAYGYPMISLITNHGPKQAENLNFAPENYKNNNINLFCKNGFDNLEYETVLNAINQLK